MIPRPLPRGLAWLGSRGAVSAALAAYVLLRLFLATLPGYANDVDSYKRWALGAARDGLPSVYATTGADYPPLFLYVLWGIGHAYQAIDPSATPETLPAGRGLTLAVKLPHVAFDLALGGLLYALVGRRRWWGAERSGAGWGALAAACYLLNPAVLFGSGYWGQPDGIHSFLALAALALLGHARSFASGASLSLAGLMKPLAAPLVPLFGLAALRRGGLRGALLAAGGGCAAAAAVFLPFALAGRLGPVLERVLLDVEAMPFTSVNAHNLWWLLGAWRPAGVELAGIATPRAVGLVLFLAVYALIAARAIGWLGDRGLDPEEWSARLTLHAAAISAAFFCLSTHMHENHLFLVVPLLVAVAGRFPGVGPLALLASLAAFFNMAWHDLDLPYALPAPLGTPSSIVDPHLHRPYTWGQIAGSFTDVVLVFVVVAGTVRAAWRASETGSLGRV